MKTRRVLLLLGVLPGLVSCSTTPLTEEGRSVKFAQVEQDSCKEVGRVFAQNWWDGDVDDVKNKLKNQAGEMGGNIIILENRPPWNSGGMRNPAYGLAFNCDGSKGNLK